MRIVIIGGGAAGMSAASKAKRINADSEVIVYDSGGFVSYAECGIPYFLGGKIDDYGKLIHYPITEFTEKRGIIVRTNTSVSSVNPEKKEIFFTNGTSESYDRLIICTGASPKVPQKFKDSGALAIRTLDSGIDIRKKLKPGMKVTIIGDGVLGMELASTLKEGGHVTRLISHHTDLFPRISREISKQFLEDFRNRIEVELESEILDIEKTGSNYIVKTSRGTHESGIVIFATGIVPNTSFLKGSSIETTSTGPIRTNELMQTNFPDIYAAGDCATSMNIVTGKESWNPLAQVSNKMGRVAGSNAAGERMSFPGSIGTTLVKIFDYEIGFAGLTLDESIKAGFNAKRTTVKARSRAAYYEGGSEIWVEIIYDVKSGKLLGSQIISKDGGAWRLNAVASAIQADLTVEDLFYTDFGYTPPFGPVWDPIIIAASLSMK